MSPQEEQERTGEGNGRNRTAAAVNLGLSFAAGMALLSYLGYRFDKWRGSGSAGTLTGMFLGLFYGAYEVWKLVRGGSNAPDKTNRP